MKSALFFLLMAALLAVPSLAADDAKKNATLPLEPARKVEFTTNQGTWLSLDVSPDGKTLLLELVGDLYTLPFAGGEARKITAGMGFNSQPRFSPDGRRITFISDRGGAENVWIADADGSNSKQLSQDEQSEFCSPVWTPDGNYVIASLWFAKTSAGTKNRAVLGRVGLNTIIARYGMKTKTLKGTNPSARGAHIYIKDRRKVGPD